MQFLRVRIEGVSDAAVRNSYLKLGGRGFIAIPFQVLVYYALVLRYPDLRADPLIFSTSFFIVINALIRLVLLKFGERIVNGANGLTKYRSLFIASVICTGGVWAGATVATIFSGGIDTRALLIIAASIGTGATVAAIADIDLFAAVLLQSLVIFVPVWALATAAKGNPVFAVSLSFYGLFMFVMSASVNKRQIELLRNYEKLAEQEKALQTAHASLAQNHGMMRAMLESINQAFLMFDSNGFCTNAPSETSKRLLAMDPTGKDICEILRVEPRARENTLGWLKLLFSDRLDFGDLAEQGIKSLEIAGTGSILKLDYHPMRDTEGRMTSVIFTATDVTQEMKAAKAAEEERERGEMILRIQENKAGFRPFLSECERVMFTLADWNGRDLETIKRDLHSIKGGAMIYGASSLSKLIYAIELKIRDHGPDRVHEFVREQGEELRRQFILWKHSKTNLFTQLGVFGEGMVEVSKRKMDELRRASASDPARSALVNSVLDELLTNEFGDLMRDFEMHVQSTAAKLGKKVRFRIEPVGQPIPVSPGAYRETLRSFVHLFNNAVDHGLETAERRLAAGKPGEGTISVRYEPVTVEGRGWIRIWIEDDGGGVDIPKIRESLSRAGLRNVGALSDLEVAMHIFDSGVSSRDVVTELSGQGVGMGSVRAAILKARGQIKIARTDKQGTLFEILLPDVRVA